MARGALVEAAKSLDPGLRYRALYNLGLVSLLAARADTSRREELLEEAIDRLREALLLQPSSAARQVEPRAGRARIAAPPPTGGGGGGRRRRPADGSPAAAAAGASRRAAG